MANVQPGRKTKPMERAEKEFDLNIMLTDSKTGQQVEQLVSESPHKFDRDYELTCATLARFAELTGRLASIKKGTDRAQARAFVDKLADLIVPNMGKMKAPSICTIVLALTQLGYAQAKLTQSVFYFLAEKERLTYPDPEKIREAEATGAFVNRKPKTIFSVGERFALLSSFAQLGVRPPPETISRVMDNSLHFLKFCSPQDTTNLVQALHSWRGQLSVKLADRLIFETRKQLPTLGGGALISLLSLVAVSGHVPTQYSIRELLQAVSPHIDGSVALPSPGLYPSTMDALIRLGIPVPPELFDAMITTLMQAPLPVKGKRRATSAASSKVQAGDTPAPALSRMDALSARELVVVLVALGLQTNYTPDPPDLVDKLLLQIQNRVSELSSSEAAATVAFLPLVLKDSDSRDDAAEVVDELLAVCEGGLASVSASLLQALSSALAILEHRPDAIWLTSFDSEILGRVRAEGLRADAAKAKRDSAGLNKEAKTFSKHLNERLALVQMVTALSGIACLKGKSSPPLEATDLESFSVSLVAAGSYFGGFDEDQLLALYNGLSALGVKMSKVKIPVAEISNSDSMDSRPDSNHLTIGSESSDHASDHASTPGDLGGPMNNDAPALFLGYSKVDHDLESLLKASIMLQEKSRNPAPPEIPGPTRRATRDGRSGSSAAPPAGGGGGWYGSGGALDGLSDLLDDDWESDPLPSRRRSRS